MSEDRPPEGGRSVRIAHLITDLDIGGAERMLVNLIDAIRPGEAHKVICMCGDAPLAPAIESLGTSVEGLGMRRGRPSAVGLWRAVRALRNFRPQAVQTWLYHADLLGVIVQPFIDRVPLIWNVRCADMDLSRYSSLTRWVREALARLSRVPATVIVNSEAGRAAHEAFGYRPRRWEVIGNGFDLERFRPSLPARAALRRRLNIPDEAPLIGMVARLDPAKDHQTLLRAATVVLAKRAEVHFYLVGPGVPLLASDVARAGLSHRVLLEEGRDDTPQVYAGLDLFVLTSAFGEGFPNVLGEAMASGVPCISTDVGDCRRIIGDTGLVTARGAPQELAEAILCALEWAPADRQRYGSAARARIAEIADIAIVAQRYQRLYQELSRS
jgi:glycosyltransferase involved in cell wall biosynthesis